MRPNRWLSRKFLTMVAVLIADIAIGLGYNVDPEVIVEIGAGIAGLWILIEGVIDGLKKPKE